MALVLYDRVRETSIVTGTSDAILLGAVTGFQSFAAVGNGNTCYYTISDQSGNWEVGLGTYSTIGPTLARTTVLASSTGSKISFPSGTKDVFLTYPAEKAVQLDASGNVSPLGTVASGTWNATTVGTGYGGTGLTSFTSGGAVYATSTSALTTGTLPTTAGGTGLTTFTAGDLPYYATGTTLSKLGIGTSGQILSSTGTAPQWTTLTGAAVTTFSGGSTGLTPNTPSSGAITLAGTLALANGGTGATTVAGAQANLEVDPAGTAVAMAIALG